MSLLSQSCAEAARLLSDEHEAPLALTARVGLRLHLLICGKCRRYSRQLRLIRSVFSEYPEHLSGERFPAEKRRQIINDLKRSG